MTEGSGGPAFENQSVRLYLTEYGLSTEPQGEGSVGSLLPGETLDYTLEYAAAEGHVLLGGPVSLTFTATRSADIPSPLFLSARLVLQSTRLEAPEFDPHLPELEDPDQTPVGVLREEVLFDGGAEEVGQGTQIFTDGEVREDAVLSRPGYQTDLVLRLTLAGPEGFPVTLGVSADNYADADLRRGGLGAVELFTRGRFRFAVRRGALHLFTRGRLTRTGTVDLFTRGRYHGSGELDLFTRGRVVATGELDLFTRATIVEPPSFADYDGPVIEDLQIDGHVLGANAFLRKLSPLDAATDLLKDTGAAVRPDPLPVRTASYEYLAKAGESLLGTVAALGGAARNPAYPVEVILPSDTDASDAFTLDRDFRGRARSGGPAWLLGSYDPALSYALVLATLVEETAGALLALWREPQGETVSPTVRGVTGERVFQREHASGEIAEVYHFDRPRLTTFEGEEYLVIHLNVTNPTGARWGFVGRRAALCVA